MQTNEKSLNSSEYWMASILQKLSQQVKQYMDKKGINQVQLAKEIGVTKNFIAQILKGKFNYSLQKLIEFSLAIGLTPQVGFKPLHEYLYQEEKKKSRSKIKLKGNTFLGVKDSKTRLSVNRNDNSRTVFLNVNQTCTITPADRKMA
jgi:transcriptional regulator with XRE-family HTH domain